MSHTPLLRINLPLHLHLSGSKHTHSNTVTPFIKTQSLKKTRNTASNQQRLIHVFFSLVCLASEGTNEMGLVVSSSPGYCHKSMVLHSGQLQKEYPLFQRLRFQIQLHRLKACKTVYPTAVASHVISFYPGQFPTRGSSGQCHGSIFSIQHHGNICQSIRHIKIENQVDIPNHLSCGHTV